MNVNSYVKAKSFEEAYELLNQNPLNKILGGGLWIKKGNANIDTLIDLVDLDLNKIEDKGDYVSIGALVTLRDLEKDSLVSNINNNIIGNAVSKIMGPAFRQSVTIGGSVFAKLGFSDLIAALLVCDVELDFYNTEKVSLEDYLKEKTIRKDILKFINIKKTNSKSFFKKVCITALDYPLINIAISKGEEYKIAIGSRPQVACLALDVMKILNENGSIDDAINTIENISFNDNLSAKADYRKHLAKIYVKRGIKEVNE